MLNFKKFVGAVVLSTLAIGAFAEDVGVTSSSKLGQHNIDLPGADSGTVFGVGVGYSFGSLAIEGEYASSTSDVSGNDLDISTTALYAVYRSSGSAYFLTKLGMLSETLKSSTWEFSGVPGHMDSVAVKESETGLSFGVGGGFRVTYNFGIELEYTIVEEDVDLIALSTRFLF